MHTGSCLCGAIRFRVEGPLPAIQICHCKQCRKAQGGAFACNIPVARGAVQVLAGLDEIRRYESSPGKFRCFCGQCGSPLFSERTGQPDVIRLRAGALDEPVAARPGYHAQVSSKCSWWEIEDDLPRYPGAAPAA